MSDHSIPFITYVQNSFSVGFNLFLDIIPFSMTFAFLLRNKDQLLMPTLNLAISYYVFAFGYLVGIQEAIGLRCSVFFGQKNSIKFSQSFYRLAFIDGVMVLISLAITFFSYIPLNAIGLGPDLSHRVYILLLQMIPAKIIENGSNLLKGLLVSQRIFEPFNKINMISLAIFSILDIILIYFLDLGLLGFLIAYYSKMMVECFLLYSTVRSHIHEDYLIFPGFSMIFQNFGAELKYTAFVSLSQYGEWIAVELNTVLAALTGKVENIIAWGININMCQYCYFLILGMSSCLRTYASIELGKRNVEGMYDAIRSCIKNGLICMVIIFICIMFGTSYVIRIFTNDPKVLSILEVTFRMYGFVMTVDFLLTYLNTLLKMIRKEHVQFIIGAAVWPISCFGFGYFFGLCLGLENIGLMIGFFLTDILATSLLYLIFRHYEEEFNDKIRTGDLSIYSNVPLDEISAYDSLMHELVSKS